MKNLKLFVAPLLGAALMTACGSKSMDVKDFKTKVEDKFNIADIQSKYIGKTLRVNGTDTSGAVDKTGKIKDAAIPFGGVYYVFTYEDTKFKPTSMHDFYILSPKLIDDIETQKSKMPTGMTVTVNYFISGDTYTVEKISEMSGNKTTEKFVYNGDFVITSSELNGSGQGGSINTHLDYKYE